MPAQALRQCLISPSKETVLLQLKQNKVRIKKSKTMETESKNIREFGTLLTRKEAREIRGGGDPNNPHNPIENDGEGNGNNSPGCPNAASPSRNPCGNIPCKRWDQKEQKEKDGTCGWSPITNNCFCNT